MRFSELILTAVCLAGLSVSVAYGQEAPPAERAKPEGGPPAGMRGGAAAAATAEAKPYEKVVTKEFKTDEGLFKVHRNKEKVLYEIPKGELGKELLWVSQIRRTTIGVGYGGQGLGSRVVKWELRGNRVLLRSVSYEITADPKAAIAKAVEDSNVNAIIMAFNVEAFAKDGAPVIDVSRLFTTDVPEFSARVRLRARAMDAARSYLEEVKSYPINIEADAVHT
jgi:hypothetical protein